MSLDALESARYSRHLLLSEIGTEGQQKLKAARVLIVGAGGLGSPAALYLAAAGIGRLGIIDGDHVDVSNLQRQVLFDTTDVGASKAERAATRLRALNPLIDVRAHALELTAGNAAQILADYDLVLDGSDRLTTRYLVNDACVLLGKALVSAAIHRFEGQAMSYVPGQSPRFRRREDCAVCGSQPTITALLDKTTPEPGGRPLALRRYSGAELRELLRRSPWSLTLVDVREPYEFAAGHMPGSIHIPLGDLPRRMGELRGRNGIVFICAAGVRSEHAATLAAAAGLTELAHLEGGLLALAGVD